MRISLLALGIVLTVGCGGQNIKTGNKNQITEEPKQPERLTGLWMSDVFLNKIEATKSVYVNKDSEPKVLGFKVKGEDLKNNNAMLYGFTSHEGGIEIPIYFNNSINKFVYDEKRTNQSSSFNESFELDLIDNNKLELKFQNNRNEIYRKVEGEQAELRRLLFEGEYVSIDNNKKVTFNRTGSLTGFDGKMSFEVIYDFGLNIEFDAIVMYKGKEVGNWADGEIYKYEFDSGTLKLYLVNTNWETMNHKVGKLTYELKKNK